MSNFHKLRTQHDFKLASKLPKREKNAAITSHKRKHDTLSRIIVITFTFIQHLQTQLQTRPFPGLSANLTLCKSRHGRAASGPVSVVAIDVTFMHDSVPHFTIRPAPCGHIHNGPCGSCTGNEARSGSANENEWDMRPSHCDLHGPQSTLPLE